MADLNINQISISKHREIELIICCSRTRMDKKTAGRIKALLSEDIDWDYTLQKSQEHSVMPLLYYNLNTVFREKVPETALKKFNKYFHANTLISTILNSTIFPLSFFGSS